MSLSLRVAPVALLMPCAVPLVLAIVAPHVSCRSADVGDPQGEPEGGAGGEGDTEEGSGSDTRGEDTGAPVETLPDTGNTNALLPPLCSVDLHCEQEIPDEPKVPCELRVAENDGTVLYDGWAGVERRGRSSNAFPKPHYSVELWKDAEGSATVGASFYGMGGESDWILNGNYVDRALFKNKLSYDLYRSFGGEERYATETVLCELTQDDEWLGVFTLGERPKRDDDRIDIAEDTEGNTFIVKNDDASGGLVESTATYGNWFLVYPTEEEATTAASMNITSYLQQWEGAAWAADPCDPDQGIFAWMDLDSAVDWVIIQELSKNNDAYFLSIYVWKDTEGPLFFMPWDHDLAYGGYPIHNCHAEDWVSYRPQLLEAMASCESFQQRLEERWWELRGGSLSQENILALVDSYVGTIGEAGYRNFEVWPMEEIDFSWDGTNWLCPVESWDAEIARLEEWIAERLAWMDANIHDY